MAIIRPVNSTLIMRSQQRQECMESPIRRAALILRKFASKRVFYLSREILWGQNRSWDELFHFNVIRSAMLEKLANLSTRTGKTWPQWDKRKYYILTISAIAGSSSLADITADSLQIHPSLTYCSPVTRMRLPIPSPPGLAGITKSVRLLRHLPS